MKKKYLVAFCGLFISVGATAATPTANLTINGDIKPPTCSVNGGLNESDIIFTYPKMSPSILNQTTTKALPSLQTDLIVTCDAATYLTFIPTDAYTVNHATQSVKSSLFGLVDTLTGKEVGAVTFRGINNKVDGKAVFLSSSLKNGYATSAGVITRDSVMGWTSIDQNDIAPSALKLVSGKQFETRLRTLISDYDAYIRSKNDLISEGINVDEGFDYVGKVTLNFTFGI